MATSSSISSRIGSVPGLSADRTDAGAPPTFEALVRAYFDCRRAKRNSRSALAFEQDLERNLVELYDELISGSYRPGESICFVVVHPKPREVWAAAFRDRVVHHLLYNQIAPPIEATFVADSCACIRGRGTHYAIERLAAKVRSETRNWSRRAWYMKCDISNFFGSVNKAILLEQLRERVRDPWWFSLAELVLMHDPRPGAILQSPPARMALVPPHKSLLNQPPHLGLPIGNLSSQFFANVYLDHLDQHIKHRLGVRHYVRYVDDIVILGDLPRELNTARQQIEMFLAEHLELKLNPRKTVVQPIDQGIDFVGYLIKPWRRITRRGTVSAAHRRTVEAPLEDRRARANSYFGLMRQADGYGDRAEFARLLRRLGCSVDMRLTKVVGVPHG